MASLPYVTATGNVEKALNGIRKAATPESVSQDFVKTILGIKGGSGNQITAYLKKIGFATADGSPTEQYRKFRNPATEGWAAAQALRTGYAPLFARNEYMYKLSDDDLKGLIVEETGADSDSSVASLVLACIKHIMKFAKWDVSPESDKKPTGMAAGSDGAEGDRSEKPSNGLGFNLGYTINLNLPATSDPAVFNAIFRALKEHLLRSTNG
jgi:hypothetical protein